MLGNLASVAIFYIELFIFTKVDIISGMVATTDFNAKNIINPKNVDECILYLKNKDIFSTKDLFAFRNTFNFINPKNKNALHDSYLYQTMYMLEILIHLESPTDTLIAAILYNAIQSMNDEENVDDRLFDHTVVDLMKDDGKQDENIDTRIVIIKIVEQLYILRNVKYASADLQKKVATAATELYIPLAARLGLSSIKWEMEDLVFRYNDPENYQAISKALNKTRIQRETFVESALLFLTNFIESANIYNFRITGRAKHIYSIFQKMQRKKVPFSEIYDVIAFRIITDTVENCYRILNLIHSKVQHLDSEFDDYIKNPKPNGYQSIHTVIQIPNKERTVTNYIEIQIRTEEMHEKAENGQAAHWKYKSFDQTLKAKLSKKHATNADFLYYLPLD